MNEWNYVPSRLNLTTTPIKSNWFMTSTHLVLGIGGEVEQRQYRVHPRVGHARWHGATCCFAMFLGFRVSKGVEFGVLG